MDGLLLNAARWLMLATLVLAPWAYGGTRPWTVTVLNALLGLVAVLWLAGCARRRTWPAVHPLLAGTSLLLIAQAWFMVLNAQWDYDPAARKFLPLDPPWPAAPGSIHRAVSFAHAIQMTALLAAACFVGDLARRPVWRHRLLFTMALTGASLVVLGLVQRLSGAPSIFWGDDDVGKTFFATWRYHANAGAFLNLCWPLIAGFAALAWLREAPWSKRIFWAAALVLALAGVLVNASRAATSLAAVLALGWLAWVGWQFLRGRAGGVNPAVALVAGVLVVGLIVAVAAMAGLDTSLRRWGKFGSEVSKDNPRLLVAQVCWEEMAPRSGWFGFGPGTWQTAFPYHSWKIGHKASGVWEHAHQDYLETLIDWGYVGAALWALLVVGAAGHAWLWRWRRRAELGAGERVLSFAVFVAVLGVFVHALVDFPLQIASIQLYVATLLGLLWAGRDWFGGTAGGGRRDG